MQMACWLHLTPMQRSFHITADQKRLWSTGWPYALLALLIFLFIPVVGILTQFRPDVIQLMGSVILSESSLNSLLLVFMTGIWALIFGISTAWVVTFYRFPLREWLDWLMILPLTVPAYVMAYISKGFFGPFGTLDQWTGVHLDPANLPVLALLMGLVLFPYVYTPLRASLKLQSTSLLEVALISGRRRPHQLLRTILPLHRTAIIGGLLLVSLEVLNEYGAPAYFGIHTYTTEIIRNWDPRNLTSSVSHALVALLLVGLLLFLEYRQRRKVRLDDRFKKVSSPSIISSRRPLLVIVCLAPLLLGFVFPVAQMLSWAGNSLEYAMDEDFLQVTGYTFLLAFSASLILIVTAVLLSSFNYQFARSPLSKLSFIANLGYSIPAAIVGIGILIPVAWINQSMNVLMTGTAGLLIAAYCMRYQSVAFNAVDGSFRKIPLSQLEAGLVLGRSRLSSLFQVVLPQSSKAILGGILIVFVDVCKELPLTMLFQRFNQETLAVKAFVMMDTEGAFYKASLPSLTIVLLGTFSVIVLRIIDQRLNERA